MKSARKENRESLAANNPPSVPHFRILCSLHKCCKAALTHGKALRSLSLHLPGLVIQSQLSSPRGASEQLIRNPF